MGDPRDAGTHDPDPAKRYRVLALTRGAEIHVEIWDDLTETGVVVPFPEVLPVAADITLELARIFEELHTHLEREDGTLPEWERQISEWRKKGPGTDGLN